MAGRIDRKCRLRGSNRPDDSLRRKTWSGTKDLRSVGLSNSASAGQRLRKKRQALIHPVIDAGMVVGELLVAMPDPKLIQASYDL